MTCLSQPGPWSSPSYSQGFPLPFAEKLGGSELGAWMLTNQKCIMAWTAFHLPFCAVWPPPVSGPCGLHMSPLLFKSLLAVSDDFSLLPVIINSEPCWDLGSSTCLFCWRVFWELCKLASWAYERKMEVNRIFTHNNRISHVGLASSEFSTYN